MLEMPLTDSALMIALVAALSAITVGLITAIVGPRVKHRLEEVYEKRKRRQEQIAKWRQMLLEVHRTSGGDADPSGHLFLHPDYTSLEPYLPAQAKRELHSSDITIVDGQALAYKLEVVKSEIARIEESWGLRA
jgi:hypothetical protein